jgi:hypothetical protein
MLQPLRLSAAALAVSLAFAAAPAQAGVDACGNIDVHGDVKCEAKAGVDCMAECTPPKLQAACAAKLEVDCQTMCTELPSVKCSVDCKGDCEAECDVKPAQFDCEANCSATCHADCTGKCSAADDSAECEAQCNATCSGECSANCKVTPGSADCSAKCDASCKGSCTADANFSCQTNCQGEGFVDCQAELQTGKCDVQCMDPEGAVFCDGQFVDSGGNARKCLDAIDAYLEAHFHVQASGTSSCNHGSCEAEGKVSCHCSTPARRTGSMPAGLAILGALGLIGVARMRRR